MVIGCGKCANARPERAATGRRTGACSALNGASNRGRTGTPPHGKAADFKSAVSTNFPIEATLKSAAYNNKKPLRQGCRGLSIWRRDPESNRATRICNPLHNRFAIAPNIKNALLRTFCKGWQPTIKPAILYHLQGLIPRMPHRACLAAWCLPSPRASTRSDGSTVPGWCSGWPAMRWYSGAKSICASSSSCARSSITK